jgi:hypothetical protein
MQTVQEKVKSLTKLPSTSQQPPNLQSGRVCLYKDFDWNDNLWTEIDIYNGGYPATDRHRVNQKLFDTSSWIAFNLPIGTVLTFTDQLPSKPGEYADLSDAGHTVDLVGTGQTEGVNLDQLRMNDKISQFFWREVDLNLGAIEIFDDQDFTGNRVTICTSLPIPDVLFSQTNT